MAILDVLARSTRGPGTFESASMVVDATIQSVYAFIDLAPAELNRAKFIKWDVFESADDGQTWRHSIGGTSQGPWTSRPWIGFSDASPYHGKRVKVSVDLPQAINSGVQIYINEVPPSVVPD